MRGTARRIHDTRKRYSSSPAFACGYREPAAFEQKTD
jgi:hypothetical protein